jgi:glyoxylase-like metal-dependent hydrolase (beta-lactamase superfamily II)
MAPGHDLDYLTSASPLPENTDRIPWPGSLRHESFPGVRLVEHSAHIPGHAGLIVDDVLLAGDMLSDIEVPLLGDEPGAIAEYRAGLEALEHAVTASGVRVIVPGHGTPAIGPEAMTTRFAADRAYLDTFEVLTRRAPSPADVTADPRVTGEVARWHAEQLARLREM